MEKLELPVMFKYDALGDVYKEEADVYFYNVLSKAKTINEKTPKFIHMAGIPFSGKSLFCKECLWPLSFAYLSFDKIMESMALYKFIKETENNIEAFNRCSPIARVIGYKILEKLINVKVSIIFDHGASFPVHKNILKNVKNIGYETKMILIVASDDSISKRAKQRERHFPLDKIQERKENLNKLIPEYIKIVDNFTCYTSKGGKFIGTNYNN